MNNYTDSRFAIALVVGNAFFNNYVTNSKVTDDQRHQFISYLQTTKYTTVMEVLQPDNQHIEDLSYLDEPELKCVMHLFYMYFNNL